MAKTKAKTVRARIAVIYDGKGKYQAGGYCVGVGPSDAALIADARQVAPDSLKNSPHACIVDIELPIPKPIEGKVLSVETVKP